MNGVIGSAIKGVRLIRGGGYGLYVVCVGLDQRVTLWEYKNNGDSHNTDSSFPAAESRGVIAESGARSKECPLVWVTGRPSPVADIACMQIADLPVSAVTSLKEEQPTSGKRSKTFSRYCVIIGEGMELLQLS